jgi:hypothetical protein
VTSKKKTAFVKYLAVVGCFSTGLVYFAIGVIAILSFLKLKSGGADEGSLLVFLEKFLLGKILVWAIMLGMIAYIIWRFYETIADPYGFGKDFKGILRRGISSLSSIADALIAFSAIQALLGTGGIEATGQPTAQREMADKILRESWGAWVIMIVGLITGFIAIVQIGYVIGKTYMEKLDIDHLARWRQTVIHILAWVGHFARGIILGIMGYFFIKTGITKNAQHVVNTDKAFDFIGDNIGHFPFIIVAIGTVSYGLFMFAFGVYYDPDKD